MPAADRQPRRRFVRVASAAVLGIVVGFVCGQATGSSSAAVILVFLLAGGTLKWRESLAFGFAAVATTAVFYFDPMVIAMQLAWLSLIVGIAALLHRFEVTRMLAIVTLAAWLLWPIWLAPSLVGVVGPAGIPAWATTLHPVFAIDPAWPEAAWGYRLTPLGQDLMFAVPASPWWAIGVHALVGIALCALARSARARLPDKCLNKGV